MRSMRRHLGRAVRPHHDPVLVRRHRHQPSLDDQTPAPMLREGDPIPQPFRLIARPKRSRSASEPDITANPSCARWSSLATRGEVWRLRYLTDPSVRPRGSTHLAGVLYSGRGTTGSAYSARVHRRFATRMLLELLAKTGRAASYAVLHAIERPRRGHRRSPLQPWLRLLPMASIEVLAVVARQGRSAARTYGNLESATADRARSFGGLCGGGARSENADRDRSVRGRLVRRKRDDRVTLVGRPRRTSRRSRPPSS